MQADVVLLPEQLQPDSLSNHVAVVFDVLRATTSITAALAAGVSEIQVFPSIECAWAAADDAPPGRLLCGEVKCLPPEGFDLGNSPGAFGHSCAGRTMLLATTNGTKALIAAEKAHTVFAGALVNAAAVARAVFDLRRDVLLLCAGTQGELAMEDVLGAGAVLNELSNLGVFEPASDTALMARHLFQSSRGQLESVLAVSRGGRNVIAAGLEEDIRFSARLNSIDAVGILRTNPMRIVPIQP